MTNLEQSDFSTRFNASSLTNSAEHHICWRKAFGFERAAFFQAFRDLPIAIEVQARRGAVGIVNPKRHRGQAGDGIFWRLLTPPWRSASSRRRAGAVGGNIPADGASTGR
jgi:hypothetical protein